MYCGHVCPCVCPRPYAHTTARTRMPPSCALLGRFAIGAPVALLWQHNANPSLHRICAHCWLVTSRWRRRSQHCASYIASGRGWLASDQPSMGGAFSTLLQWPGLQASNGGVLATMRTQNVSEYMLVLSLCLVKLAKHKCSELDLSTACCVVNVKYRLRTLGSWCSTLWLWMVLPSMTLN